MLKGLGDIGQMMKLQREFKNTQKKLTKATMQGGSAGGEVTAVVNGEFRLISLAIDPQIMKTADAAKIEQMIIVAVNDAVDKMKVYSAEELSKLTGGLNVPGLTDFFK